MAEQRPDASWQQQRREAVAAQAERLARAEAREVEQARTLIADFLERARERQLPTEELRAVDAAGRRYRTGVRGWVLRRDGRAGVGEDGAFYVLTTGGGVGERLASLGRGLHLRPTDPPLVLGRGGRDGDSVALADLLERRLADPA